jgi:hypothetical protein
MGYGTELSEEVLLLGEKNDRVRQNIPVGEFDKTVALVLGQEIPDWLPLAFRVADDGL